ICCYTLIIDLNVMEQIDEKDYEEFLKSHEFQLLFCGIPKYLYCQLYFKMKNEIFDCGKYFQICPVDDDDLCEENFNPERKYYMSTIEHEIKPSNVEMIFLIDHAWTYRIRDARKHLLTIPKLYERMLSLMNINETNHDLENGIEMILQRMWKYNQTYTLATDQIDPLNDCEEVYEPYWYIMDEVGSMIRHSDTNVNLNCVSFYFQPSQTMYSVIWPIEIIPPYTECFRNYLYTNQTDVILKNVKLLTWNRISYRKKYLRNLLKFDKSLFNTKLEYNKDLFLKCHKNDDYIETTSVISSNTDNQLFKVYTDNELVKQFLNDSHYQFVDNIDECNILFTMKHIENYRHYMENYPQMMFNQFPYENIVTNKELLSLVARRWKHIQKRKMYVIDFQFFDVYF
ncbi:unnamed protein product, partial [Didymodactylos carnosus]